MPVRDIYPKNIAILVFNGVEILDFAGPYESFATAGRIDDSSLFNVYTISEKAGPIAARDNLSINPQYSFSDTPHTDILLVPGGPGTEKEIFNDTLIDWIKSTSQEVELLLSVCDGAVVLGKAGLLENLSATTHHLDIERLKEVTPNTLVKETERIVDNGRVITCAGVSAGIDMSLYVVSRLLGKDWAVKTARLMEYDLKLEWI